MAPLGVRTKLARVHVLDHALAQRGDSLGCHRQLLSGMRLLAPPSSRQGASPATYDLAPGDNACRCARGRSLSRKRFSAMALSGRLLRCSKWSGIESSTDDAGGVFRHLPPSTPQKHQATENAAVVKRSLEPATAATNSTDHGRKE